MTSLDEPRPNFRGAMGVDAVTGRMQPQYPRWKTNAKVTISPPTTTTPHLIQHPFTLADVLRLNSSGVLLYGSSLLRHVTVVLGGRTDQALRIHLALCTTTS